MAEVSTLFPLYCCCANHVYHLFSTLVSAATLNSCPRSMIFWRTMVSSSCRSPDSDPAGNTRISFGSSSVLSCPFFQPLSLRRRGLFMNKYVFPGADASCSIGWVINKVCAVLLHSRFSYWYSLLAGRRWIWGQEHRCPWCTLLCNNLSLV